MKPDDLELHSLTERLMKQAGTVTPPSGFTERVMDSIMQPEPGLVKSKPYWPWLLLAIFPVMVALSWYFFMPASVNDQIVWYLLAAAGALQHLFTSLLVFFRKLSDFSSLLWMGTAAVFSLLLLEEFLGKRKVRL